MSEIEIELSKCRDAGSASYTYFWVQEGRTISPYFSSEKEAQDWLRENIKF